MKINNKKGLKVATKTQLKLIDEIETDALESMLDVENKIRARLINRDGQVRAMMLAVVSQHNLLLDGPPGTAKTRMGSLFAESVVGDEDFTFFKTQMMKNTLPEQLFGPINVMKMRQENPVYEYATERMLPQAHFAVLEEVYRASEMVLSSMLTILNERQFHNGGKLLDCPLISAIGTTNFVMTGEEIEAFNDRWLMRATVMPLKSTEQRMQMLQLALETERKPLGACISLNQIRELHEKRRKVKIPSGILDLYEQLAAGLNKNGQLSLKLTDRRLVQTLDLIQASAVLRGEEIANEDDLLATEYGLTNKGSPIDEAAFSTISSTVIGNYAQIKLEQDQLKKLREKAELYEASFDENLPKEKATRLAAACRTLLNAMSQRAKPYVSSSNETEYNRIHDRVTRIARDTQELIEMAKM